MGALPGIEAHPHARSVLVPALPPANASHAYLFHGPPATGKRRLARAFAAALLADGAPDPSGAAARVSRGTHPDLTWVRPSGAAEMLVADVEGPVIEAASRTPFEASRRVFVIESAEAMNDQTANRMLKTLEEPLPYVHLILLTEDRRAVLPTIASRCQHVRFDAPPVASIAQRLAEQGVERARAESCARLSLGDSRLARWLAGEDGERLRAQVEGWIDVAMRGDLDKRPWLELLELAKQEGTKAAQETRANMEERAELLPEKEQRRLRREGVESERRAERRRRAAVLDLGLRLAELSLRDCFCIACGASSAVHGVDREAALRARASAHPAAGLCGAVELVAETRMRLQLHVSEELALEVLSYRLAETLGA